MTYRQAALLEEMLHQTGAQDVVVRVAMTYGEPVIAGVIAELRTQGVEKFLLLPLYPQYSGTTTGAIYDQVSHLVEESRYVPDVQVVRQYCYREDYISALANSIREHRAHYGSADVLLFSFHGIPKACIDKGDPYYEHCSYTANAVAEALGLSKSEWHLCFQSRFGRAEWLQPYTDEVLVSLPATGIGRVDIICPAFASDCLETLEEIEVGSRECFIGAGAKLAFCVMDYGTCPGWADHCLDTSGNSMNTAGLFPNYGLGGGGYNCFPTVQGISSGYLDVYWTSLKLSYAV